MIETMPAIRREVIVEAEQAEAFRIFTADMTSWWPPQHHVGSAPIAEIVIEPRAGGRWFTRHTDGGACHQCARRCPNFVERG